MTQNLAKKFIQKELDSKIQKHKESVQRSVEKDKQRKVDPTLKMESIKNYLDYTCRCVICNRKIKKVVETNKGSMGYRCFLTQIGVPTDKQRLDLSDFPNEAFESVAESYCKQIEETDIEQLALLCIRFDLRIDPKDIHFDSSRPIKYYAFLFFDYFLDQSYHIRNGGMRSCSFIPGLDDLREIIPIPQELFKKMMKTKYMNLWISKQQACYRFLRRYCGVEKDKFHEMYDIFTQYYDFENRKMTY